MAALLRQGLGDRIKAVAILHPTFEPRSVSQAHPSNPDTIHVGLIFNPEHAFRLVDHGPAADEPDLTIAERFREFWGDKAELRRFKDGRIVESVVWDVKTSDERTHVPSMIVRHILSRHFSIGESSVQIWQSSFDSVLRLPEAVSKIHQASGIPAGFKAAMNAFDTLVKGIKALDEELPLTLLNISPVSEYLRYTSVFSPVPLPASSAGLLPPPARYLAPMEIILEFEKSSRWPDDLRAIQKIKLAFFERVASVLMSSIEGLKASVVIGDGVDSSEIRDQARLEIITPDGWAFSARIWHDREATLLDRIIDNKSGALPHVTQKHDDTQGKGKDYREAVAAKELYVRRFIHAPRHHRAIAALCHHYSAYAGTVRLVKRWLASHWLLNAHITEEAIEIICAGFFIGDGRNVAKEVDGNNEQHASVPGSKERGFALVVEFLKEWKWEEGLFVPLYGEGSDAQSVTAGGSATSSVWRISTEVDREGHVWTWIGPDVLVAHRVRSLAKATWDFLQGMENGNLDVLVSTPLYTLTCCFIDAMTDNVRPSYRGLRFRDSAGSKLASTVLPKCHRRNFNTRQGKIRQPT